MRGLQIRTSKITRSWASLVITCFATAIGGSLAAAKDCQRETPIPPDTELIAPAGTVADELARFAGVWNGAWRDEDVCTNLVVEEVHPNGFVRVVYSYGAYEPRDVPRVGFFRGTGRIVDGGLKLTAPNGVELTYRLDGQDGLQATRTDGGPGTLAKVASLAEVGCLPATAKASGPGAGPRARITAEELLDRGFVPAGPVRDGYFAASGEAGPARHEFAGVLTIPSLDLRSAKHGCRSMGVTLPGVSMDFFTHGDHLVPATRDFVALAGSKSRARLLFSPGRIWSEPTDGGLSRAAFPFVLTSDKNSASRNGLATFLYDDTRVSALRLQVTQEAVPWSKFDLWGQVPARYFPGPVANQARFSARFAQELSRHTPIRPWSELPLQAGSQVLADFDGDAAPEDISASGLVVDGAIYLKTCHTRTGDFPYCGYMRHQAFSVTKSMGAALALLRLAQKYGEQVFGLKITDYVDVTAAHDGWAEVTFADALDMATGIGDAHPVRRPLRSNADEEGPKSRKFWRAGAAKEKLDHTFSFNDLPWGPGEVMRYNNTHTFVLAAAMDAFLKSKEGSEAQLWDMVAEEVLGPIGVFHAPMLHTREVDGSQGIPLLAVGLYPTVDDVAKIATLLHNGGAHGGRQLLSRRKLDEALYRTPARGLPATFGLGDERTRYGDRTYHLSFWRQPYRAEPGCLVHIPYMAGRGGNHVMLLPNGVTAFRFADGEHYDIEPLVLAGETIRPFCSSGSADPQASARDTKPLGADELRAELPGSTFYSPQGWHAYFTPEGSYYVAAPAAGPIDFGGWRITGAGHVCWTETSGGRRRERCATAYRRGETFEIQDTYRWRILALDRKRGNPEGY